MTNAKNSNPFTKIDSLLRKTAQELPRLPGWWKSLAQLTKASPAETRLAVYQAIRDDGCFAEDVGFFLVSLAADCLAASNAGPASKDLDDRRDRCFIEQLMWHGELEMADLFRRHSDEFDRRQEAGRRFFFEPAPPDAAAMRALVQTLFDHARRCVKSDQPMGPVGCRWRFEHEILDLQVFPTPVELVGGPQDGAVVDPDIDIALLDLQDFFDEVTYVSWSVEGENREYQYVWIQGIVEGYDVWLTIFAGAPDGERPTVKSDESRKWRAMRRDAAD